MKYALFALGATVILFDMFANLGFGFGLVGVGLILGAVLVHGLLD